jgi:hypothetical protein
MLRIIMMVMMITTVAAAAAKSSLEEYTFRNSCHEDVRGRGGIAPRILNLGTRWT